MAQNFKQRGDILQYTNTGSADVASEELIVFGALAGVALADIPAGGTGSVQISGGFSLPKKADDAPTQGQALYWNATDKVVTVSDSVTVSEVKTEFPRIGKTAYAAAGSDTVVEVLLN